MRPAALAFALLLAAPAAFAAPVGKTFKDWELACDNVGDCVAHGFQRYVERRSEHWLRLDIKAGPDGRPQLSGQAEGVDVARARILEAPAELAGKPLVEQLIGLARTSETATLASDGTAKVVFSLAGLAATLIAIDEAQGRIGTTTALIRPGAKPASAVPGPRPLPRLRGRPTESFGAGDEALAKALARRLKAAISDECPRQDRAEGAGAVYRLSRATSLVELYCDSGAYNFGSRFWLVEGRDVARAKALVFRSPTGETMTQLINPDYDAKTGELSFFGKGRGVGDCGQKGGYVWSGRVFDLAHFAQLLTCNGVGGEEIGDWPALFRSQQ